MWPLQWMGSVGRVRVTIDRKAEEELPMKLSVRALCVLTLAAIVAREVPAAEPLAESIAALRAVGPKGEGHVAAVAASQKLAAAEAGQLPVILVGMDGASALATNWLRAAFEAVAS